MYDFRGKSAVEQAMKTLKPEWPLTIPFEDEMFSKQP
jgi:hypothetical protein